MTSVRTLLVDTNATRSVVEFRQLTRLAQSKGLRVVVSAQTHLEDGRQTRVARGAAFDAAKHESFLEQHQVEVQPIAFDAQVAVRWAGRLAKRYPGRHGWEEAKRKTLHGRPRDGFEVLPGEMPMTTDWLIALAAEDDADTMVVTDDGGAEWIALRQAGRAKNRDEAIAWLTALPAPS